MGAFFKTFFVCLVLTFSFLAYKFFEADSFNHNLAVSKESKVFGIQKDNQTKENTQTQPVAPKEEQPLAQEDIKVNPNKTEEKKKQTYTHTCYFYSNNGELTAVKRELNSKPTLESQINLLLKGPLISESKKGMYSEIPANVDLISADRKDNTIIINLTSNFGNGGGSQSIINRVRQLAKTVKNIAPNKDIYLYINNKEVEYLGGDGVYIKQPLEI